MLANVREDATAASAKRAVRLLGTYCDLASVGDAILSSLETRYPSRRPISGQTSAATAAASMPDAGQPVVAQRQQVTESVPIDDDNGLYQKRCLEWLRPRLPMAWVLNQMLLGRVPVVDKADGTFDEGGGGGRGGREREGCLGRGLAADLVRGNNEKVTMKGGLCHRYLCCGLTWEGLVMTVASPTRG